MTGIAGNVDIVGNLPQLFAIALLGTVLAVSNWARLLVWQRFSSLLVQTIITHAGVLLLVAHLWGFDFAQLAAWDAAIFAACYVSYCAHLAHTQVLLMAAASPARYSERSRLEWAAEFALTFLHSTVYRAVYSWSDFTPLPGRYR